MSAISQINSFNKVYNFVERYDIRITNIRVFGTPDINGNCKEPFFLLDEVLKYLNISNDYISKIENFTDKETLRKNLVIGSKIKHDCIVITKYGLIRCVSLCNYNIKSTIAFRYFVYGIFDCISNIDNTKTDNTFIINDLLNSFNDSINASEVQEDITQISDDEKTYMVYFIINKETDNINIGYSDDIEETLKTLQIGNDCELKIIKLLECETHKQSCKIAESIQSLFYRFRIRGRWYKITESMINSYCY